MVGPALAALLVSLGTASAASPGAFWQLTDVHVDLEQECCGTAPNWYGSFDGQYGCGSSVEAVNATAAFMARTEAAPDFVLFTGDATASGPILDNMRVIRGALLGAFAVAPIYIVLGNHDFPGSPVGDAAAAWYAQVAELWGGSLEAPALASLRAHGYYATTPLSSPGARLIALNTELFNHGNDAVVRGETLDAALAHLAWLNATLRATAATQQRAYIIGHVPIGYETAYGNDRAVPSVNRPYWLDLFARRYADIVDAFGEALVAVQIFGHEHVDTFRLLGQKTVALTAPSLSTAYPRTNPTVRLWRTATDNTTDSANGSAKNGANASTAAAPALPRVVDYEQFYMDLLASNAAHTPLFARSYSFRAEYGLPDLSRASFEALLARFQAEQHGNGQPGWSCSAGAAGAIYVDGRSVSRADHGFNATRDGCAQACAATGGCGFWQWGHTTPDFAPPLGWCYLYSDCGALVADAGSTKYEPKYAVTAVGGGGSGNASSYARERRFFLSSTPTSVQPPCDAYCRMQDLCDKATSGAVTSNACFTECLENNGRALVGTVAAAHVTAWPAAAHSHE